VYQILYNNNYPHHFIAKVHHKVKSCHLRKLEKTRADARAAAAAANNIVHTPASPGGAPADAVNVNAAPKTGFVSTLKIPYVPGISESIHKIAKQCLKDKIRVVYSCKNTLRKLLMHVKPKKKPLLKNCVYQIECECKAQYIGQTNSLTRRIKEHKDACKKTQQETNKNHNKLALHAQKMNHSFNFENTTVIHFEENRNKRVVAESMAMIAKENVISQSSRNIDKIFWKNIKDDEQSARGKKYFCEKASFNSVSADAPSMHVQPLIPSTAGPATKTTPPPAGVHRTQRASPARPTLSYFLRPRARTHTQGAQAEVG
jgi:predicted GIY-YIG superfamily endonuclease